MPAEPNVFGYVGYLLFLFLPGIGFAELLGLWRENQPLLERTGVAFGVGLSVDTLVLLVRTSGISVGSFSLRGIGMPTVYFCIALGLGALLASAAVRRRVAFAAKPSRLDLALLLLLLFQGLVLLLYFQKYPIFPEYQSQDFGAHVELTRALISGASTSFPAGLLYYGVHFQLGAALLLVGGIPLATLQRTMAILVVLSPLLVFAVAGRLFEGKGAALVTAVVYSISGSVWLPSVFGSGLFPNFFGILASLWLLYVVVELSGNVRSPRGWLVLVLALVMAYFSHYTTVTLLPALLVVPAVRFLKARANVRQYLYPVAVAVAPAAVGALAFPSLTARALALATGGGGTVLGSTTISSALSAVPVLGYMALEVSDDVAFVLLVLFAAVYVYQIRHTKNVFLFVPPFWLLALLVAAPFNVSAWRFSFEALVPLTLMAGYGVYSVVPKPRARRRSRTTGGRTASILVLLLLLTPILVTSWGEVSIADSLTDTRISANSQQAVYAALGWLDSHTPSNSTYLSVSDWRFTYSSLFFGRTTDYEYIPTPADALNLANQSGIDYIIVTNIVTVQLPPNPSLFPWNTYNESSGLILVHSNGDVRIFKVA